MLHNINKGRVAISYNKETPKVSTTHQSITSSIFSQNHSFINTKKNQVIIPRLCEMTWFNILLTFIKIKNHLNIFGIYLCF
jgi:hypothetical protein